jgi:prepilin-type processing-associated H-X9-DG protein
MTDFENGESLNGSGIGATMTYTFNEPHPGYLVGLLAAGAKNEAFAEFPAYWHNRSASFVFADGHAELHRWVDLRTCRPIEDQMVFDGSGSQEVVPSPHNADIQWLCDRSSSGKGSARQDPDIVRALDADPSLLIPFGTTGD